MAPSPFLPEVCHRTRQQVSLRLDSKLSEFEEALVAAHLAHCDACSAFTSEIESFTDALRTSPLAEPSLHFTLPRRPSRVGRAYMGSAAAAAVVAAVVLGNLVGLQSSPSRFTAEDVAVSREIISVKEEQLEAIEGAGQQRVTEISPGLEAAEQTTLDSNRSAR